MVVAETEEPAEATGAVADLENYFAVRKERVAVATDSERPMEEKVLVAVLDSGIAAMVEKREGMEATRANALK
eukprot:3255834-Pleurochrysis_carterae.AAC.1